MTRLLSMRCPSLGSVATLAFVVLHLVVSLIPSADWVLCIEPDLRMTLESSVQGQCTANASTVRAGSGSELPQVAPRQDHCGTCTDLEFLAPARFPLSPSRQLLDPPAATALPVALDPGSDLHVPAFPGRPDPAPTSAIQFRVTVSFRV